MKTSTSEESWEFWKPIVCNEDGSMNTEQVKKELHDFLFMIQNVPVVYDHITGGIISKPLTDPKAVIDQAEEHYRKCFEELYDSKGDQPTSQEVDDSTQKENPNSCTIDSYNPNTCGTLKSGGSDLSFLD